MLSIPNQLEAAYVGQDVTLECHTEAYPSSINYWTTDRGDMIISGLYLIPENIWPLTKLKENVYFSNFVSNSEFSFISEYTLN